MFLIGCKSKIAGFVLISLGGMPDTMHARPFYTTA